MNTYNGSCHCGTVKFQIEADIQELTTCNCSICSRKNMLIVTVHKDQMKILAGEDALTTYTFGTHAAKHYFCKVCGIHTFYSKRIDPDLFGVNANCLEAIDLKDIPVRATDGKSRA